MLQDFYLIKSIYHHLQNILVYGTIQQVPNTYSHYSDIAMETLLQQVKPVMEKHTGIKLSSTYSYARIYKEGDVLARHKDRYSCEISTTLNLGGESWPIYLDPTGRTRSSRY